MDDVPDRIEHTVLGPTTGPEAVRDCLDAALQYGMRACLPPWALPLATEYANVPVTAVVDFPHGQGATDAVCSAARTAWDEGADELDVVCNVGRLKAGEDEAVRDHLSEVVAAVPIPVKVIVEAPLLSESELHRVGGLVADAGAAYCKTATGFSEGGATVEDVELLSQYRPVKASGGIGSWAEAEAMFEAGAERIGASSGDTIVEEWHDQRSER
ncbi:deoxyribose-phosphate aldolase [Haloarcula laminariae]|uniref:deoxyribose-phosphate aldolase n=1 Tax=Haloarcula laminariae TaxID=2961577 RepID=UPI0021C81181|nr:deoxyribose-phosphate aldolase [Halomicroarcula laminariae]